MGSRIRKILEILLKNKSEQTIKTLSMQLDVSEKTIRDDINLYIQKQNDYPIQIVLCNKGYKAIVRDSNIDQKEYLLNLEYLIAQIIVFKTL